MCKLPLRRRRADMQNTALTRRRELTGAPAAAGTRLTGATRVPAPTTQPVNAQSNSAMLVLDLGSYQVLAVQLYRTFYL